MDTQFLFWGAQAIGVVALVIIFFSFQARTREEHLWRQMTSSLIFIVHYAFLGAWTGMLAHAILASRNVVFVQKNAHRWARHIGWLVFFSLLSVAALYVSWHGFISILPIAATLIGTYARWKYGASAIRLAAIAGVILWLPYALAVGSYAGVATQLVVAASTALGMYKYDEFLDLRSKLNGSGKNGAK